MMRTKAVIAMPNRTLDVKRLKNSQMEGEIFRHDGHIYKVHPDRMMLTEERNWKTLRITKITYATYYYRYGKPTPLPFPDFKEAEYKETGMVDTSDGLKAILNDGIGSGELSSLFTPWFYRVIAAQALSLLEQLALWLAIGTAVGVLYLAYSFITGNYSPPK